MFQIDPGQIPGQLVQQRLQPGGGRPELRHRRLRVALRNALACADALRAAAAVLADHDDAPTGWTPTGQHDHPPPAVPADHPTAATTPTPSTDTLHSSAPQYPPGLDVSKYVRAPLAPQHPTAPSHRPSHHVNHHQEDTP